MSIIILIESVSFFALNGVELSLKMLLILIIIAAAIGLYSYVSCFKFWRNKGVKQAPTWTSIKENFQTTIKRLSFMDLHLRNYRRDSKLRYKLKFDYK